VASHRYPGRESQLDVSIVGKKTHAATGRREGIGYLRDKNGGEERKEEEAVIAGAPAGAVAAIATALRQERRRRRLGRERSD
jgi:hypothetical protein